jgi:hypothetical protein
VEVGKNKMLKRLGLSTLALAAAMAVAVPTASMAAERNDHRGRDFNGRDNDRHERVEPRGRDDWRFRGGDRARVGVGFGFYNTAPAPAANGYYDRFGVWHPYGYYDQWGNYHPY